MPRLLLAVLLVIAAFLGGCGPSDSDFVGTWKFDADATRAKATEILVTAAKAPEEQSKAKAAVAGFVMLFTAAAPSLEVKADKTCTMAGSNGGFGGGKDQPKSAGTWSRLEGTATFILKRPDGTDEKSTGTVVQGKLQLQQNGPDGKPMVIVLRHP
jgi:hypothetical protein